MQAAADANSNALTYSLVSGPTAAQGTVTITNAATGAYSFIPAANFNGSASFTFLVTTTGDTGESLADRAPDGSATWVYPTGTPSPPPPTAPPPGSPPAGGKRAKLKTVKPRLAPAVAGKAYTVSMIVTDATTKKGVKGKLTCQAKLSGKVLKAA